MNVVNRRIFSLWSHPIGRSSLHSTSKLSSQDLIGDNFYSSEHREFQETIDKIFEKDINPNVKEWEEKKEFPAHELFKKLGQAGILGIHKPKEYGGLGLDYMYNVAMLETLGKIKSGGLKMAISIQTDMATAALTKFGSDALKKEFLVPSITGEYVATIGVSEPEAGSDVAAIATKAEKQGGDYIINGSKMWITSALQADWINLLANTSKGSAHHNKSLICVPMKTPGIRIAKNFDKLGMRCTDTGLVHFENVRVPQKNLIGEEGKGFLYQMLQFQEERLAAAFLSIQPLYEAINSTIEYCRERKTFGKPILHNQYVHFRLAELATEVEAFRALVYQTARLHVEGKDVTKWTSMCKLKTGRLLREVVDSCLQYWGGMGYTNDIDISREFRDERAISIVGGTDEMMLVIISKSMNMLPNFVKNKPS